MRQSKPLLIPLLLVFGGCERHVFADYRPLDAAGMWSGAIQQLKALHASDAEIAEVVKLKKVDLGDDTCIALVSTAHDAKHQFASADSVISLMGARYTSEQILDLARAGQLDTLSADAVMLRLILSDSGSQFVLDRHLKGLPTLSTSRIARLKNTGLSEAQVLGRVKDGMTDEQADKEIASREATRNHANTDFVRNRGRKPH
jgi:hypothetical protein